MRTMTSPHGILAARSTVAALNKVLDSDIQVLIWAGTAGACFFCSLPPQRAPSPPLSESPPSLCQLTRGPRHSPFNSYRLALQCRRRGGRRLSVGNTPVAQIQRGEDERIHRQWQGCRQIQDRRKVLVPRSVRCGTFRGRVSACCRIAGIFSDD